MEERKPKTFKAYVPSHTSIKDSPELALIRGIENISKHLNYLTTLLEKLVEERKVVGENDEGYW
jgi:hypothetical protein